MREAEVEEEEGELGAGEEGTVEYACYADQLLDGEFARVEWMGGRGLTFKAELTRWPVSSQMCTPRVPRPYWTVV